MLMAAAPNGNSPLVMADEEGGVVQRLLPLVGDIPSARVMGATMSPLQIENVAKRFGVEMKNLGLTMDLAPVADIDSTSGPNATTADGTRSFSGNRATVSNDALAFARGLREAGIIPVVKHFPGLGGASGNTDLHAASTVAWSSLIHTGLVPFKEAIKEKLPAIMVSNASIPGLSSTPAALSRVVITGELRDRLHFKGLVMTDSLTAVSITSAGYSLPNAVVASLEAGADMVLFNAAASSLVVTIQQITSAVISAITSNHLSRAQLVTDAATVLATKHFARCSLVA
jgi:beta-N-acetylhexosaminidase